MSSRAVMAHSSADAILGLAVQEVLSQYSPSAGSAIGSGNIAIYEHHFQEASKLGNQGAGVDVESARRHFSHLLQGDAFDAILERVQQGCPTDQLSKEQFLTITHLASRVLEAAQNSDALWVEPAPAPSMNKKRHPTVQEALGCRLLEAQANSLAEAAEGFGQDSMGKPPRPSSGSKENVHSAANTSSGPLEEGAATLRGTGQKATPPSRPRSPGKQAAQPTPVLTVRGPNGSRTPVAMDTAGTADITDFERKLQDLMRRMQQDQAKLQGRPAGGAAREEHLTQPTTGHEDMQAVEGRGDGDWESFNNSPPLAGGRLEADAGAAFVDFASKFYEQLDMPSPFSELNPLQPGQQASAEGMRMGYPQPPLDSSLALGLPLGPFASPADAMAQEAQLHTTPVTGSVRPPAPYSTPAVQHTNHFAAAMGALDPSALMAAMQQLSIQQALAAQLAASGAGAQAPLPYLDPVMDPAAAAAVARAQAQLEAAAASLVAAATARPQLPRSGPPTAGVVHPESSAERATSSLSRRSSLDTPPSGTRQAPFTARDHHSHNMLGRHMSAPAHALGPLGEGEHRLHPRPSRFAQQASAEGPATACAAGQSDVVQLSSWQPMPAEDLLRCEKMFTTKGYEALGGMSKVDAQQLLARIHMAPHLFEPVWTAADMDRDGVLSKQEFCLFMYVLRNVQKGYAVPLRLTPDQAADLLGLDQQQQPAPHHRGPHLPSEQPPMKVDLARIRSALRPGRQQEAAGPSQLSKEEDALSDSDDDSGFESLATMSVSSRCSGRMQPMQAPGSSHLFRPSMQSTFSHRHDPDNAGHSRLVINIRGAEISYSKALEKPFFNISVHDSLLRTVELPQDTPPGHYRKEMHMITLNHAVELQTQLAQVPRGSVVYIELKHFKSREGRMSTLAWTYLPLEKVVDFGLVSSRVREGPLNLPLFRKPMDLSLRKLKRLGKRDDLRLTIGGVAAE